MGCGPTPKSTPLQRADTLVGIMKVTILDANFPTEPRLEKPLIKLRVSNQSFTTKALSQSALLYKVNENFTFTINSFFKSLGRTIEVGVFDDQNLVAYGAVDANPIINNFKGESHQFRVILNQFKPKEFGDQFGFATLRAQFQQLPATSITFRFESATIRRKLSSGESNVAVRVIIGEQILQTNYKMDTSESPPIWKEQMLNFKVPHGVKKCIFDLINDKGQQLGTSELDLDKLFQVKTGDELYAAEQLFYKEQGKSVDAANLKFSYIIGEEASFSQIQDVLRSSIRGIRGKNQLDQTVLTRPNQK